MRPARWAALSLAGLGGALAGACAVSTTFTCASDDQCTPNGQCLGSLCAFPDDDCDSGLRYGEFSPAALAGACVEPEFAEGSGTGESGGESAGTGSESSESGSESETETGLGSETGADTETETGEPEPDLPTELPPAEVLAYYTFDTDTVLEPLIRDTTGNSFHAMVIGDNGAQQDAGVSGEGYGLGGATWLELPAELLEDRSTFTVECYLSTGAESIMGSRDNIFYYGDALEQLAPPRLWALIEYLAPPTERLRLKWTTPMGTETAIEGTTDIVTQASWFHVALTVGPEGTQLWVDHLLESKDALVPTLPSSGNEAILVGALPGGVNDYSGRIDELRVSDRALAPEEMLPPPGEPP